MKTTRRRFLQSGLAFGALATGFPAMLGIPPRSFAQAADSGKKLLFIFQRGGNDGLNTVIPRGDSDYGTTTRPSIFIPESAGLDLGNGFAQLHPAMAPMMEIFNRSDLNGVAGPGNLAVIHRVAYANQSRSHFDSQDYWERGVPGDPSVDSGMFYRQLAVSTDLDDPNNAFSAASLSGSKLRGLEGDTPFPNFTRVSNFNFYGTTAEREKFLGSLPGQSGGTDGRGMLGLYGGPEVGGRTLSGLVHATGQALGGTLESLKAAQGAYAPENGAVYPGGSFGDRLREAAMLFKRTSVRILGVNIDGHDTHTNQGAVAGSHANRLEDLAEGFRALYLDLQGQWEDLVVVTMTEFGRTSEENGSSGTDHAEASVMFVAGGGVNGGVYNCDAATWETGAMFSRRGRYLDRRTDFRAVFGEIFMRHFGDSRGQLDTVIPGYSAAEADYPDQMAQLGFMA